MYIDFASESSAVIEEKLKFICRFSRLEFRVWIDYITNYTYNKTSIIYLIIAIYF